MKSVRNVLYLVLAWTLAACGVTADHFPGTAVPPPVDLAGSWHMTLGETTSVFVLTPAASNHYQVMSPTSDEPAAPMDASIQAYRGAHYLVVADTAQSSGMSVFRIQGATPDLLRIAAFDPNKTEAVLKQRGLPVVYKKMWLYNEIALTGPALEALLALPPADVFAVHNVLTLTRQSLRGNINKEQK